MIPVALCHPCSAVVHLLACFHQLPVRQNDGVHNLSAEQTFPSPKLFMMTVKFFIGHGTAAARAFCKKQWFHSINLLPRRRVKNGVAHRYSVILQDFSLPSL
jgi:hypothetical protein